MIHIVVFPTGTPKPSAKKFLNGKAVTARPGTATLFKQVVEKFGEAKERQSWSGETAQAFGLAGTVYWWGNVGLSQDGDGKITNVLLRGRPKP